MTAFYDLYPMALKDTLASPAIESYVFQQLGQEVPWPALKAVKTYAEHYGHSAGAVRTGVSRAKKTGELLVLDSTPKQLALGPELKGFVRYYLQEPFQSTHFSLVLTRLTAGQDTERYKLNDHLTRLGHVKFLPNAYLRYGGDPNQVQHFLQEQGLADYVYAFQEIDALPGALEAELDTLYDLPTWKARLNTFAADLDTFLNQAPLDTAQGYQNYLFARSSFHKNIMTRAPYLPERYFPEVALIKAAYEYLGGLARERMAQHRALYLEVFGG